MLPHPNRKEEKQSFISRCMGSSIMLKEFPEQEQRAAVCFSQFKKHQESKSSEQYNCSEDCPDCQKERETIIEALKSMGIWLVDTMAKQVTQCDNCKLGIDTRKPSKPAKTAKECVMKSSYT